MHFPTTTTIATMAFAAFASSSIIKRQDPQVKLFTEAGCSGGQNEIPIAVGTCHSAYGVSAQQDKGENGIKYTCNGYSDSACKDKVGEVYDCLNQPINYVQCYENVGVFR